MIKYNTVFEVTNRNGMRRTSMPGKLQGDNIYYIQVVIWLLEWSIQITYVVIVCAYSTRVGRRLSISDYMRRELGKGQYVKA